jgi:hypothetical protein
MGVPGARYSCSLDGRHCGEDRKEHPVHSGLSAIQNLHDLEIAGIVTWRNRMPASTSTCIASEWRHGAMRKSGSQALGGATDLILPS